MQAKELFAAGDLSAATRAVTEQVKSRPTDLASRTFLFELLCFAGELDRAQKQLEVIGQQNPDAEWATQVYANLLEAERQRRRFYRESLKPEYFLDPPAYLELRVKAAGELREGRAAEALELIERSDAEAPEVIARLPDDRSGPVRDCDDLLAPVLEFMILRDYAWVPWEQVSELEITAPEKPRDLIWAPARLTLVDGTQRRGYLPALYCNSYADGDDRVKLGRMTDWSSADGEAGPLVARGLHTLAIGDDDFGLLEIRKLTFQTS